MQNINFAASLAAQKLGPAERLMLVRQAITSCDVLIEQLARASMKFAESSAEFDEIGDALWFFSKLATGLAESEAELQEVLRAGSGRHSMVVH